MADFAKPETQNMIAKHAEAMLMAVTEKDGGIELGYAIPGAIVFIASMYKEAPKEMKADLHKLIYAELENQLKEVNN